MISHAPPDYTCPFCALAADRDVAGLQSNQDDVIFADDLTIAFVASHWWAKNRGHVLVIPKTHFENMYEMPDHVGAGVFATSRRVAIAMKRAYRCDGISTRQHNEPAGFQTVWHYHLHVFPRYAKDRLYLEDDNKRLVTPAERVPFARLLRQELQAT